MDTERRELVALANQVFGERGWSVSVSNVVLDYVDDNRSGKYSAGSSALVKILLNDGSFREDLGYGWSFGTLKAEVISKAKKDAVTDAWKGALMNFGEDLVNRIKLLTPKKQLNMNTVTSPHSQAVNQSNAASSSTLRLPPKLNTLPRAIASTTSVGLTLKVPTSELSSLPPTSPVMPSKASSAHLKSPNVPPNPKPQISPPPAILQPPVSSAKVELSAEDLAKMERKRRQKQRQEEFRQKHLLEQAQSKVQIKQTPNLENEPLRAPLREQQQPKIANSNMKESAGSNGNTGSNAMDADDEVLLSTQDMEAAVKMVADNSVNISKRTPVTTSPSFVRSETVKPQLSGSTSGQKRPDTSNTMFSTDKKLRDM